MKRARVAPPRALFVRAPTTGAVKGAVQQLVLELVFGQSGYDARKYLGERPELPGPLPIALNNRHLRGAVSSLPYGVCEKSDGERAMLLLVHTPRAPRASGHGPVPAGAYLIDRTFGVDSFEGGAEYAAAIATAGGPTLVEGELVLRRDDAGTDTGALAVLSLFDCIACGGRDIAALPLKDRLGALSSGVREPFKALEAAREHAGTPGLPLYLLTKVIVSKGSVRDVLSKVHTMVAAGGGGGGGGIAPLESEMGTAAGDAAAAAAGGGAGGACHRMYRDGVRVNGTDGLIFTPGDVDYRALLTSGSPGCAAPLLKWKWADENTVDFRVMLDDLMSHVSSIAQGGGRGGMAAGGRGGGGGGGGGHSPLLQVPLYFSLSRDNEVSSCHCPLTMEQVQGYIALCDRLRLDSLIVECAYAPLESAWHIRRVRDKKTRCNHLKTAWSTLEVLAEDITPERICSVLAPRPAHGATLM